MSEPVTEGTFRAAFERIAASRDREEAEEAYGEFEEVLEAVLTRVAGLEAALRDVRPYVVVADDMDDDADPLLARIDELLGGQA